ncbi:eukaryotic-like serine/threonine-protein kinase [Anaerolineales bacterium]|nr:eukaryotic-like serine/threonine-protein kinase [Anaerolineales bacterium]
MILENETLLHKRYQIRENLGQGGMGSVYRAIDENLGVDVAVKENLFTTEEYARQFRLEAVILANIRHPNLPRVSDHFVIAGEGQYLVMDFIEGEDLRQRMERVGVLPEDEVILIGAAMCDALSYLHARKPPILHRDIKPGNVKISPDGHIFLVDFGLAKVYQGNQATTTGARAMTPGYSPPEQYGTARTDTRTDIYSLGATLYAALTGVIPEDGLARAMDNAQLTPLRKRNPSVSRHLASVIEKAMEVDPADRFQTADDFKMALLNSKSMTQQLLGTYTITPPPSELEKISDPQKKSSNALTHAMPPEEYPFVSPRKKQLERERRNRRILFTALFTVLVVGFIGAFFFPNSMPEFLQRLFPFLPPAEITPTPLEVSPSTEIPLVENPVDPTATATATEIQPTAIPVGQITPTPIGADYLQIAYASTRTGVAQIYLTGLLGDEAIAITNMPGGACQPSWSPDGNRLVFTSPCAIKKDSYKGSDLYIINVDGSGLQQLPSSPGGGDFEPAWSPDGKKIAFTSLRDGYMQIYSYDVDSGKMDRLVKTPLNKPARQPSWSPDSRQIIYAYQRIATYELWLMSSLGSNERQFFASGDVLSNQYPSWSPDGQYVLFSQRSEAEFTFPNLFSIKAGEPNSALQIKMGVLSVENVNYSPGGNWIAYESGGDRGYHVYYSTPSGANQARVTEDVTFDDFDPAWRPIPK